ncbi:hypothetical protein CCZ01_06415 [Helicobacter monodelphidis]|uniref:RecB-like helicase n=1 Tax=Helicobacter sp. 15-1451 TaxID=2004995 RepID=UPI000DCDA5F4|nr:RecB-like helicase [Helicobacter sp. 15-1451]RAX57328.1 hypothetical protein CCZ01_06415 [Helicobacter sp. 15-1451]
MAQFEPFLALKASAGSGKTFALSVRYILLLLRGANASEILTLTFTNKATSEMKRKITHALHLLAFTPTTQEDLTLKQSYIDELLHMDPRLTLNFLQEHSLKVYEKFLVSDVMIMTIDAFLQSILHKFCWYVNIPYHFQAQENSELDTLSELFLAKITPHSRDLLLMLAQEEDKKTIKSIFPFFDDLLLHIAENQELMQIQPQEIPDQEILNIAYKIKDAVNTYSSKNTDNAVDFYSVPTLLKRGATWLTKKNLQDYRSFKKIPALQNLQADFIELKQYIAQYFIAKESRLLSHIFTLLQEYQQTLNLWQQRTNSLRFNDAILKTHELLCNNKISTDFLYFRLDSRITHILIDEFQDTNLLQYYILEPLIHEIVSGISTKNIQRSFFYVGDTKQSIYRFRGSMPELFDEVRLSIQQMRESILPYNWRSQQQIVEFINDTFTKAYQEIGKDYIPQQFKKEGGFVHILPYSTDNKEVFSLIITEIKMLLKQGITPDEIAILVLKNNDIEEIATEIKQHIPTIKVIKEGISYLGEYREVKALKEMMLYAQDSLPIHAKTFFALVNAQEKDEAFFNFIQQFLNAKISVAILIKKIMEHFQLFSIQAKKVLEYAIFAQKPQEVLDFIQRQNKIQIQEELCGIRILTIHASKGLEFPRVFVIDRLSKKNTQNKGLLFDYQGITLKHIFSGNKMRENFDENYKQAKQREAKRILEEDLNLLYVAFTRAKKSLHIFPKATQDFLEILHLSPLKMGELEAQDSTQKPEIENIQNKDDTPIIQKNFGRQHDFLRHNHLAYSSDTQHVDDSQYTRLEILKMRKKRQDIGKAFHLALEYHLKFQAQKEDIIMFLYNQFGHTLSADEINESYQKCEIVMQSAEFLEILSKGKIKCEVSFLQDNCLRRIDLLILGKNKAFVIDYKSGKLEQDAYYKQIKDYIEVVSSAYKKPTEGFLLDAKGKLIPVKE